MFKQLLFIVIIFFTAVGCKKDPVVFTNNTIPDYNEIPTITIRNYVNRLYIDLIGREPLDVEMDNDVEELKASDLSAAARTLLVTKLTTNTDSLGGDVNYQTAYFQKLYSDIKSRLIEGVSDATIEGEIGIFASAATSDSLEGNWESYQENVTEIAKLQGIIDGRLELQNDEINIDELYRRMMFNSLYDQINMNSFNFVNASFDNLYYRFPTQSEFNNAFNIIENNEPSIIFGEPAINKSDYLEILTSTGEFRTGLVQWVYLSLMSREPSTNESFEAINNFEENNNISLVQLKILISDEYAGFE